jgi:hypothetical protein
MGREARQRKERRNRQLTELALTDPKRFDEKWSEKIETWTSEIWCAQREQAHFTFKEYDTFISQYPKAKTILADLLRYTKRGCFIYLDKLNNYLKDELGPEAIAVLTSRVKQGGLRGEKVFEIADHAQKVLSSCGERVVALHQKETAIVLENECCRALAVNIGNVFYSVNQSYEPKSVRLKKEGANNGLNSASRR